LGRAIPGKRGNYTDLLKNVDKWKTLLEVDDTDSEKDDSEFLQHIWEGFVVSETLSSNAIMEFLQIGVPGMLQVMFEWWA
jgi:hypothetical protein